MRDADKILFIIRSSRIKTSIRHLRLFVSAARGKDMFHMTVSPQACSDILVSCKETLRELGLNFAPNPNATGLDPIALQIAPLLESLELSVTAFNGQWCEEFLGKCVNLKSLVLTFLSTQAKGSWTGSFIANSCPKLEALVISSSDSTRILRPPYRILCFT